jgi:hypothetical protein
MNSGLAQRVSPRIASCVLLLLLSCGGGSSKCPLPPDAASEVVPTDSIDVAAEEGLLFDLVEAEDRAEPNDPGGEPSQGGFGAACTKNGDCDSGFCIEGVSGPVCSRPCLEDCPQGWSCRTILVGPDLISLCVQVGASLCHPCTMDTQCPGGRCIGLGDQKVCGLDCVDDPCPDGYSCLEVAVGPDRTAVKQCVPKNGACDCTVT